MANIVTWQERGINLLATKYASKDILNVLTKVHFVQFATFQQPEHKRQILGREVTSCLKPIASSHSEMSKTSLYGYIVHVDSAVRKECSEGIFVIKYVIYGSVNHLTIFVTCSTHLFEHFHDAINDWLAPLFTELQAMFWTLVILLQKDSLDIEQSIDQYLMHFHSRIYQIGITQIMASVEPTGLSQQLLSLQVFDYGWILRSSVCNETYNGRILEDFLFLQHVVAGTFIIEHHTKLFLQGENCQNILYCIFQRVIRYFPATYQQTSCIIVGKLRLSNSFQHQRFKSIPQHLP